MKPYITVLILFCGLAAKAVTLDSLIRENLRRAPGYDYTTNDTAWYKLSAYDLRHQNFPAPAPTHFFGATRLGFNRIFLHFERQDKKGRQAILVTCDTQFTNPQIIRIGLTGKYFEEYDSGKTLPMFKDSTRGYYHIQSLAPYTGLSGLIVRVYSSWPPIKKRISTYRSDLWHKYFHIASNGYIRKMSLVEQYARFSPYPLRLYHDSTLAIDESHINQAAIQTEEVRSCLPPFITSIEGVKANIRWAFKLNEKVQVMCLRIEEKKGDFLIGLAETIVSFDTAFALIDKYTMPIYGAQTIAYNNGRAPIENMHIYRGLFTMQDKRSKDAEAYFTVNNSACRPIRDQFGDRIPTRDAWIEYHRISSNGKFVLDSTKVNGCLSHDPYSPDPQLRPFPTLTPESVITK